jgi:LRR-repeat protein 1
MKILCDVAINSRDNRQPNYKPRYKKSTLAIGQNNNNKNGESESNIFLAIFNDQHKQGLRFKLKKNIKAVFTKFVHEGKLTISLTAPPQDILIKSEQLQLKAFINILKMSLNGTSDKCLSNISVTAIPSHSKAISSLEIRSRSEYPTKGIPRTITSLRINGINRCSVDTQICYLKNLTSLDLSNNCITTIPSKIGDLTLKVIDFSCNKLCDSDWKWLSGEALSKNLASLNLSENQLIKFPYISKLRNLITLKLNHNQIKKIPFAVHKLTSLRYLHIENNSLESLPQIISTMYLDTTDISNNLFTDEPNGEQRQVWNNTSAVTTLWELAGRVIIKQGIPYSAQRIPSIMVDVLDSSPLCKCGVFCFNAPIYEKADTVTLRSKCIISNGRTSFRADCVFCSAKCYSKTMLK